MSSVSPAPGVPQTATKAVVAAVLAAVATALTAYFAGTDVITVRGLLAAAVAGGVAGVSTYFAPNKAKSEAGVIDLIGALVIATFVLVLLIFLGIHLHVR